MLSWKRLVSIDPAGILTVNQTIDGEVLSVEDAGKQLGVLALPVYTY